MHTIVPLHSIICIKPRELLFSVILAPMSLCNPFLPSSAKKTSPPSLSGSCLRGSCLLLSPSSPRLLFPLLPPPLFFILSSSSSHRISSQLMLFFPLHQSPIYHLQASHLC